MAVPGAQPFDHRGLPRVMRGQAGMAALGHQDAVGRQEGADAEPGARPDHGDRRAGFRRAAAEQAEVGAREMR